MSLEEKLVKKLRLIHMCSQGLQTSVAFVANPAHELNVQALKDRTLSFIESPTYVLFDCNNCGM